ncbi:MAG TPA: DUF4835 family protein [Bacteroidetes bacterium]|nr:DUF4835 family protein [Bacteroidota bacterium]
MPESSAQTVKADVKVNLEKIPMDRRHKLTNLQEKLEAYINDYEWTSDEDADNIYLNIRIFLQDISSNFEDRYAGQFLISNNSDQQFFDKRWRFDYSPGDALYHQENAFNPMTSLIDFYVYIVIGGEYDKLDKLAGTKYFSIAQDIAHQGQFSRFPQGWDVRQDLIKRILGKAHKIFRNGIDAYYLGLSYKKENPKIMYQQCEKGIQLIDKALIADPQDQIARQFIKSHSQEIIDIFKDSGNQKVFQIMVRLDPNHKNIYSKYIQE